MADKVARRGVSIYIDGSKVSNSVKGIKSEMVKLTNEQAKMIYMSDEYVVHARKIAQLDNILQQHKDYQKEITKEYGKMSGSVDDFEKKSSKSFSGLFSMLKNLKGTVFSIIASFTIDKLVDEFSKLDDAQANVRKYTGLTREEIKALNNDFNNLNTRTASIRLNELAGDAGRLGIEGSKGVLEFVDAANIIDVALGEDLGEDAIKSIGKLAQMFGDSDRMGLKRAMLSTGSAINEVAQNSSAAESYLVDFTNRMAGTGVQADIAVPKILGYASVLDQNAQQVEMSATALSGLLMKLYQDPAKFARMAGLDVTKFTKLLKSDANEALLQLLDTLGKKGGLADLAPIFKDLQLDGARASSVISVLAGNIENIRKEQKTATDAFNEGKSVINEYDIQNNTFSANLDKQKKIILGYITDIGEKLAPMVLEGASSGNVLLKVLSSIISILIENKTAVISLGLAYVAYITILRGYHTWQKTIIAYESLKSLAISKSTTSLILNGRALQNGTVLQKTYAASSYLIAAAKAQLAGNVGKATIAMRGFFSVISVNPYVALLVAIPLVFKGIAMLNAKFSENGREMEIMKEKAKVAREETEKHTKEIAKEESSLTGLLRAIINTNEKSEVRKQLIIDIKKQYPELLKYLDLERMNNLQLLSVLKLVNDQYEKRYEIAAYQGKSEAEGKSVESLKSRQIEIKERLRLLNTGPKSIDNLNEIRELEKEYSTLQSAINKSIQRIAEWNTEVSKIQNNINELNTYEGVQKRLNSLAESIINQKGAIADFTFLSDKDKNAAIKKLREMEAEYDVLTDKLQGFQKEQANAGISTSSDSEGTNTGKGDKASVQRKKMNDALRILEEQQFKDLSKIKQDYINGDILSEEAYNDKILEQQDKYDAARKNKLKVLLKSISDPSLRLDIAKQIADIESKSLDREIADKAKKQKDAVKQQQDLLKWNEEETKKILESSLKYVATEEDKAYIKQMQLRVQGKISEAEYQKELTNIQLKYLKERLRINGLSEEQIAEIRKQILETEINTLQDAESKRKSLLGDDLYLQLTDQLKAIDDALSAGSISFGEAIMGRINAYIGAADKAIHLVGDSLSGAWSNYASAEESRISRKYDKEIAAAEGNSKKQKKLEEQKQKEINAIKAKYADKQFAVSVAQTISSTAVAAMEAFRAMAGIPVIGPALGAAAAAAAIAYGNSQIAVAKEQRDAAKEGYFDGGYTGGNDPKVIRGHLPNNEPIHGMEFVANRHSTANGLLRPLFDVIDDAQRHNTVSSITKSDLAKALNIPGGYYQGGYNSTVQSSPNSIRDSRYDESYDRFVDVMERLEDRLDIPFKGYVTYKGDDGIEEAQILDEKMKKNISR